MTIDDKDVVSVLCSYLAERLGNERYALWFGTATRWCVEGDVLVVGVPNAFFQEWLRTNFCREIETACQAALGRVLELEFRIDPTVAPPTTSAAAPLDSPTLAPGCVSASAHRKELRPCSSDRASPPTRRSLATLQTFVVGPCNHVAHVSAQAVIERPGCISPLLLYGPTGVGKTHLLEAIHTSLQSARRTLPTLLLSAEQFTSSFLEALHGHGLPSFRRKMRGVEVLLIDDVQFFVNKRATLGELLHTIDALTRDGRQLVFTADRGPAALGELGPELVARLHGGVNCELTTPDAATRAGIVRQMATTLAVGLADDVCAYVAENVVSHPRALAGAIKRLHVMSLAHNTPITLPLATEMLADAATTLTRPVGLGDIESAVCRTFGIELSSLRTERKSRRLDHARMLAMWLARKHTRAAFSEIGTYFGGRTHSTVISAQRKVEGWLRDGVPLRIADRDCRAGDAVRRVEESLRAG